MDPLRAMQLLLPLIDGDDSDQLIELLAVSAVSNEEVPKVKNFIALVNSFDDDRFQKHFRLKRSTCNKLIEMFGQSDYCPKHVFGPSPKSPEAHILSFIWCLSNRATLQGTSKLFDMAISTFHEAANRVINFFFTIVLPVINFSRAANVQTTFEEDVESLLQVSSKMLSKCSFQHYSIRRRLKSKKRRVRTSKMIYYDTDKDKTFESNKNQLMIAVHDIGKKRQYEYNKRFMEMYNLFQQVRSQNMRSNV